MCELVHCLDETTLSFSPNTAVFSLFHHSNSVISSQNTCRWLFFLFEDNTSRRNLTKVQTLGADYTFPKVFGALNPNPTLELLHHLRFFKFPNLKVQNTQFFAILGVILYTVRKFKKPEVILKKFNSRCNLTPSIAKNSIFCTFRLGFLENLTWWSNSEVGFGFSAPKSIQKSIVWSQGLKNVHCFNCFFVSDVKWWTHASSMVILTMLFLFHCEQTRHLSCAQLSHVQMFSQYVMHNTYWNAYHVC